MLFGGFGGAVERCRTSGGRCGRLALMRQLLCMISPSDGSQGRAFLGGRRGGVADPSEVAAVAAVASGGR